MSDQRMWVVLAHVRQDTSVLNQMPLALSVHLDTTVLIEEILSQSNVLKAPSICSLARKTVLTVLTADIVP